MGKNIRFAWVSGLALVVLGAGMAEAWGEQGSFRNALASAGYAETGSVDGRLNDEEESSHEFWLQANREYVFAGTCDSDCTDLDLKVFRRGQLIVEDTDSDAVPRVSFTPAVSGTYVVRAVMYSCTVNPCSYEVDQYRR